MTATLEDMAKRKPPAEATAEQEAAAELLRLDQPATNPRRASHTH